VKHILLAALAASVCIVGTAFGQSTIFNMPTTDTVSAGHCYTEQDLEARFAPLSQGGYQTVLPRFDCGVSKDIEVGANFSYFRSANANSAEVQTNVKWRYYSHGGFNASVGGIAYLPVNRFATGQPFGMIYTNVSEKLSGKYAPRLTFGGYALVHRADGTGSKSGIMAGIEQPLFNVHSASVSFVTDWLSGTNHHSPDTDRFGYVTPGIAVSLPHGNSFDVGWSMGNQGAGNNGLYAWFGHTW
jgi:hypothetical protein